MKKPVTIEDIAELKSLSNIMFNPSGTHAVFTEYIPDRKKNENTVRLFVLDRETEKVRQLTYTANHGCLAWDDDETILLQTKRKDEDSPARTEEKTTFYRICINGGEACPAFTLNRNVQAVRKIRDDLYLLKIEDDFNRVDPEKDKEAAEEELDYHVLEEVPFWANGAGYIAGLHTALFLYKESDGSLERITPEMTDTRFFTSEGNKIMYASSAITGVPARHSMLSVYDLDTKETVKIVEDGVFNIRQAVFRDEDIVFLATDMKTWGNGQEHDFYAADLTTGEYHLIAKNTEEMGIGDISSADIARPGGNMMKAVGNTVYFTAMKHYHTDLYALNENNEITLVQSAADGGILCFDADEKGNAAVYFPADYENVITVNGKTVYDPNAAYFAEHEISVTVPHTVKNRAGMDIEGWVLKPYNYDPEKTYPAVFEIHGGPRAAYGRAIMHEMQAFAGKEMFVIFCNPRGSEGYGEAFADIRGKYGTIDYEDLMDYLDGILEIYPNIDSKRIAACGGSYGGFMCNWIEGHTDRFACVCSQRSISNWLSDFGTSEIGMTFDVNEMNGTPWTKAEEIWNCSPLKYADRAKSPILFIHSLVDYNCMVEQGAQMFAAMKYFGVPARMCIFEGESHGLSRVGRPKHRIRRLREMSQWIDKYCF